MQEACRNSYDSQGFHETNKKIVKENPTENSLPCYERLTELVEETLCERPNGQKFHNLSCVMRLFDKCGIKKLKFSDQEISQDGENVKWSRFKYAVVKGVENSDGHQRNVYQLFWRGHLRGN